MKSLKFLDRYQKKVVERLRSVPVVGEGGSYEGFVPMYGPGGWLQMLNSKRLNVA
jgi:allophanate hydrolase subunit 1